MNGKGTKEKKRKESKSSEEEEEKKGKLGCIKEGFPLGRKIIGQIDVQQELAGVSGFPVLSLAKETGVAASRIKVQDLGIGFVASPDWPRAHLACCLPETSDRPASRDGGHRKTK